MSAVSAIYKAPIVGKAILPDSGEVSIIIQYQGRIYQGIALRNPEDPTPFSEKIGCDIALSRARIEALEDWLYEVSVEANIKARMYREVTEFSEYTGLPHVTDPTGLFVQNACRAIDRVEALDRALHDEREKLERYLHNHAEFNQ